MRFTLDLAPGSTYNDLARLLFRLADKWAGVTMKPEHGESVDVRNDNGDVIARWELSK